MAVEGLIKSHNHLGGKLEDYVAGVAVTESGLYIPVSWRWNLDAEEDYVFQVTGTEGTLTVNGFQKCVLTRRDKSEILYEHDLSKNLRERHKPGIKAELEAFSTFLKSGEREYLLNEAMASQEAVELLYTK